MRYLASIPLLLLLLVGTALADDFQVGQRVLVKSLNRYGVVKAISPIRGAGGHCLEVQLDGTTTTIDFDPNNLAHTAGAPPAPAQGAQPAQGTPPAHPANDGIQNASASDGDRVPVPNNAPPSKETFMRLIRRQYAISYPYNRVTVTFQTFDVAGPLQWQEFLTTDNTTAHGRVQTGYKVHSQLTVRIHKTTAGDRDMLRTVADGHWRIYKNATGEWLAGPDGDTTGTLQYLDK